jgi:chromodomain-containing protein
MRSNQKLAKKYFGPFKNLATIGKVAYQLQLPHEAKIHYVFHVSQLKAFYGELPQALHSPDKLQGWRFRSIPLPEAIINKRMVKANNAAQTQYLVKWRNSPLEDASWMDATAFVTAFPSFDIET